MVGSSPRHAANGRPTARGLRTVSNSAQFLERLRGWGRGRIVALVVAAVGVLLNFVSLHWGDSGAAATFAEGHGIDLEIGDWSASLIDLAATAEDVVARVPGPFEHDEVLRADAIRVDLSLWSGLRGRGWVREVLVDDGDLYLERLVSGRWNWEALPALDGSTARDESGDVPDSGRRYARHEGAGEPVAAVRSLGLEALRTRATAVEWVEHLPSRSGSGLIHSQKASMFIDDVESLVEHVHLPLGAGPEPLRFTVEARIGDGRLSIDGRITPSESSAGGPLRTAAMPSQPVSWPHSLRATIYLDNIGAGAFNRLLPLAAVAPVAGSMDGEIRLLAYQGRLECVADLVLSGAAYAANPDAPSVGGRRGQIDAGLRGYTAEGPVWTSCGGDLGNPRFRPVQAMQTALTLTALEEATPGVREAVVESQPGLTAALVEAGLELAEEQLARRLSAETAAGLTDAVGAEAEKKGLVGKIKGLFKKKKADG